MFRYWLVKWGGYDDTSWEPNTNVSSVQADKMIKTYKTEHTQWQEEEHSDAKNQCLKTEPWTDKTERNQNIYSLLLYVLFLCSAINLLRRTCGTCDTLFTGPF